MDEKLQEVRKIGPRGMVTIPKRFWETLGLDGRTGSYVRLEVAGPREIRITPDTRDAWWAARTVGETVTKEGRQRAATKGADTFVKESLGYCARNRVLTVKVQQGYEAWLAVQGGEVPRTSLTHLGRAVMRVIPQARRSRMIVNDGSSQPVYVNVAFRRKKTEPGQPDGRPEDEAKTDLE